MQDVLHPDPPLEWLIAALAISQHGVVALWQLLERGLSASAVRNRVAAGRLHRVHAGVYAVGHAPLTRDGWYMAAVLACGCEAALSHRSAAAKRALRADQPREHRRDHARQGGRRRKGIDAHTSTTLLERDVEEVDGIRCTTVARTLLDLAAVLPRREVERAFDQAEVLQVLDARQIEDVLDRTSGHRGTPSSARSSPSTRPPRPSRATSSRSASSRSAAPPGCRSPRSTPGSRSSRRGTRPTSCGAIWRRSPRPTAAAVHATRRAFESDRRRDQRLMLAGYRVVRFSWRQVIDDPREVAATLRGLLRRAA